jgi:hypothetical protein
MPAEDHFKMPLTLTLSPQAGRGDDGICRISLLPVYGEKVPDRADEGRDAYTALLLGNQP